jgi:hypothetical protein
MTGMPQIANAVGELDVDIILDEGPDTITMMADTYDAISQALPSVASMLKPQQAQAILDVLIETSPLPAEVKKKFRDASQPPMGPNGQPLPPPPPPEVQKAQMQAQIDQQKNQADLQLQQQKNQNDAQAKMAMAQADIQIEREKAQNQMAIEEAKASNAMRLEREMALSGQQMEMQKLQMQHEATVQRDQHALEVEAHRAQFRPPEPAPPAPPPVDHMPALMEILHHLSSRKRASGVRRTPQGLQVVYEE